jgi:hypothetical protein
MFCFVLLKSSQWVVFITRALVWFGPIPVEKETYSFARVFKM